MVMMEFMNVSGPLFSLPNSSSWQSQEEDPWNFETGKPRSFMAPSRSERSVQRLNLGQDLIK